MWPFSPLHLSATCPIGNLCRSVISHTENIRHRHVAPLLACARARGPLTVAIARTTNQASRTTRSVHAVATCSIARLVSRIFSLSLSISLPLSLCVHHTAPIFAYTILHTRGLSDSHRNSCVPRQRAFVIPAFSLSSIHAIHPARPRFISTG